MITKKHERMKGNGVVSCYVMSRQSEAVITRMERAGGALSEAIEREPTGPLRNSITTVNMMIGDLRRAAVRIERGESAEEVCHELDRTWAEAFGE
jgi:hypothetical protein